MQKWIYYWDNQPLLCLPINDYYLQQDEFWETLRAFVKSKEEQRRQSGKQLAKIGSFTHDAHPVKMTKTALLAQAILLPIALPQSANEGQPTTSPHNAGHDKSQSTYETAIYQKRVLEIIGKIEHIPDSTALIFQTSGTTKAGGHLVGLSWEGIIGAIVAGVYSDFPQSEPLQSSEKKGVTEWKRPGLTKAQLLEGLNKLANQDWILAIPGQHIGGFLVILRSVLAGKRPHLLPLSEGFSGHKLAGLIRQLEKRKTNITPPRTIHISLVPTQIQRCLKEAESTDALKQLSQILIGGAATSQKTQKEIRKAGLKATYTYGMTETCGGCVYDGIPLPGSAIRLKSGRVYLQCSGMMTGYLDEPPGKGLVRIPKQEKSEENGEDIGYDWLKTNDLGQLTVGYGGESESIETQKEAEKPRLRRLEILGRIDRVAVCGGKKIPLGIVQNAIDKLGHTNPIGTASELAPWLEHSVVTKIPDTDWGEIVTVAVTATATTELFPKSLPSETLKENLQKLRTALEDTLPKHYLPRAIVFVAEIPLLANGKIDQIRLEQKAAEAATATSAY